MIFEIASSSETPQSSWMNLSSDGKLFSLISISCSPFLWPACSLLQSIHFWNCHHLFHTVPSSAWQIPDCWWSRRGSWWTLSKYLLAARMDERINEGRSEWKTIDCQQASWVIGCSWPQSQVSWTVSTHLPRGNKHSPKDTFPENS